MYKERKIVMDIKEKINEIVEKIKNNVDIKEAFEKNPVKAIEDLLGVDLPDEAIEKIVDGVKAKISLDKVAGFASAFKKRNKNNKRP